MLEPKLIEKLEKRAAAASQGYGSDVNITCYVYGQDMIALLNERRELLIELGKWRMLAEEREKRPPGMPPVENGLKELEQEPNDVIDKARLEQVGKKARK